jgi:hypothetical protein
MSIQDPGTFLELVQRFHIDAHIAGSPPTAVVGLSTPLTRNVNYVAQAWMELQSEHEDWDFMQVTPGFSLPTVAGQQIYAPSAIPTAADPLILVGSVSSWKKDTFRVYLTSAGFPSEVFMEYYEYDDWRDAYQLGTLRTAQVQPIAWTVLPNLSIGLQTPLTGYTVIGDYYSAPLAFAAEGSVPSLPAQYRMLIVYKALMTYGLDESASEVYSRGQRLYTPLHNKLVMSRLPIIRDSGALA